MRREWKEIEHPTEKLNEQWGKNGGKLKPIKSSEQARVQKHITEGATEIVLK